MIPHGSTQIVISLQDNVLLLLLIDLRRRPGYDLRLLFKVTLVKILNDRVQLDFAEFVLLSPRHRILNLLLECLKIGLFFHLLLS